VEIAAIIVPHKLACWVSAPTNLMRATFAFRFVWASFRTPGAILSLLNQDISGVAQNLGRKCEYMKQKDIDG